MKKKFKLTTIALLLICSFSCDKDDSQLIAEPTTVQEESVETNTNSTARFFRTECDVIGSRIACPGQSFTYTYISDISNPNVTWTWSNGITPISGLGTSSATFRFNSGFTMGTISAIGVGSETCSDSITIKCGDGVDGENESCDCPTPTIDDRLCVSGRHPHWRFQVDGINASDQITWSVNHGTIHSNPTQSYVIIEPNSYSYYGFTVYCKVSRTCSDGTTKERTAYYTNYYGNSCGTGTTGYTGSCNGGSMIDDFD